jgi:ethanolamine utilization protein EutA
LQTQPLKFNGKADFIVFSGGVSEYIYGYESKNYGDLGRLLGEEIRKRVSLLDTLVAEPFERIRATVIGESQHTVQISGTTNLISSLKLLPMKNLPVVAPNFDSSILDQQTMEEKMMWAIGLRDLDPNRDIFALVFRRSVINQPSYLQMKRLSNAIVSIQRQKIIDGIAIILVFEADIGMGLGRVIQEDVDQCNLISIDEILLGDFNFIDIGEPTGMRGLIPVNIKSLIFLNQKLIH